MRNITLFHGFFPIPFVMIVMILGVAVSCTPSHSPDVNHFKWRAGTVELSLTTHLVSFPQGYSTLDPEAAEALDAFLFRQSDGRQKPDLRIYAVFPLSGDTVNDEDLLAQRQSVVADYAATLGFPSDLLPPRGNDSQTGGIVVEAAHYVVTPPACPDWSGPSRTDTPNALASNFGCATARNLSLMVAHPRDLIHGRRLGSAQAPRLGRAVEKYRQGDPLTIRGETTR